MSYLEGDELLTKQEVIEEIMDRVQNQLWSSKDESIMEFATTVGVNIVATTNSLFWKKIIEKTDESIWQVGYRKYNRAKQET